MSPESPADRFACAAAGAIRNLQLYGSRSWGLVTNKHEAGLQAATNRANLSCDRQGLLVAWYQFYGYTFGMKTAVSIPDDVFEGAQRLARRTKRSRSRLVSDALREYLARHSPEEVTDTMNKACAEIGELEDPFVSSAARRILERSEW